MRSKRKNAVLFFLFGLLFAALAALGAINFLQVNRLVPPRFSASGARLVHMRVGETVPLWEEGHSLVEMRGVYDEKDLFLDAEGRLHAGRAGRYDVFLVDTGVYYGDQMYEGKIGDYVVIVEDTDYSGYTPVTCLADIDEEGKYILASSFTAEGAYDGISFRGTLVNPDGYTITLASGRPLFKEVGEEGVVSGLKIDFADGVFSPDPQAYGSSEEVGTIACINNGAIVGCTVRGTLVSDRNLLSGVAGVNGTSGVVGHCSFTGEAFGNVGGGIAGNRKDEGISCCTVQADAFIGMDRDLRDRVSLFCGVWDAYGEKETKSAGKDGRAKDGNRVFNLEGTVEVDFTRTVTVCESMRGGRSVIGYEEEEWFVGSVVTACRLFREDDLYCVRMEDSLRGERDVQESVYAPDCEEFFLEYTFRYKETKWTYGEDGIERIDAAEEKLVLPEGSILSPDVRLGTYSPAAVTLVFTEDTRLARERGGVKDGAILLDFTESDLYIEAEGDLYLRDGNSLVLVRFGGGADDGLVTIPAAAARIGGDPFGALEFEAIDTANAVRFYAEEAYGADSWRRKVKELYVGAAFDPQNLAEEGQSFPALEYIEMSARADGYAVTEEGFVVQGEGDARRLVYIPAALAEGQTLTIAGFAAIGGGALRRNGAREVVLEGVAVVEAGAFDGALLRALTVCGETVFRQDALSRCGALRSVTGGGGARITLESGAIRQCIALAGLELSEAFAAVAYDAVQECSVFRGYTLAAGCTAFDVRGGLLFVEGKTLVPRSWQEQAVVFAEKEVSLTLYGEAETAVPVLFLDASVYASIEGDVPVHALYSGSRAEYRQSLAAIGGKKVTVYYYSETEPVRRGRYWHYDEDGKAVLWD